MPLKTIRNSEFHSWPNLDLQVLFSTFIYVFQSNPRATTFFDATQLLTKFHPIRTQIIIFPVPTASLFSWNSDSHLFFLFLFFVVGYSYWTLLLKCCIYEVYLVTCLFSQSDPSYDKLDIPKISFFCNKTDWFLLFWQIFTSVVLIFRADSHFTDEFNSKDHKVLPGVSVWQFWLLFIAKRDPNVKSSRVFVTNLMF